MDFINTDNIRDLAYNFYKYCDCTICGLCFPELYEYCENLNSKNVMDRGLRCDLKVLSYIGKKMEGYKDEKRN